MPERVAAVEGFIKEFGGWLLGIMTVLGTIFYNSRKVEVDQSALILGKWKDLVESHQSDIKALKEEFAAYKTQTTDETERLRKRLSDVEDAFAAYKLVAADHIASRDEEIAGLKAAIRQNSQSAAMLIRSVKNQSDATDNTVEALDESNAKDHNGIKTALEKLGGMGDNSRGRTDEEDDGA